MAVKIGLKTYDGQGNETLLLSDWSSLHLDLIADFRRINSHICSIAYPILEQAGVLARTRLKEPASDAGRERAPRGRRGEPGESGNGGKSGWQKRKPHTA